VLAIDEQFLSKKDGYATPSAIYAGKILGRSEAALEAYLGKPPGKERAHVCMDLVASIYRAIIRTLPAYKHRRLLARMRRRRYHLNPEQRTKLQAHFEQSRAAGIYRYNSGSAICC
jgi:hypothetical protein